MDVLQSIQQFAVPVIVGICLCVGYIIKHFADAIPNKWIPLIMGCLGLAINLLISPFSAETILAGLFSGLASTGLHNLFKNLIEHDDE
jgi:hypothetical protein